VAHLKSPAKYELNGNSFVCQRQKAKRMQMQPEEEGGSWVIKHLEGVAIGLSQLKGFLFLPHCWQKRIL